MCRITPVLLRTQQTSPASPKVLDTHMVHRTIIFYKKKGEKNIHQTSMRTLQELNTEADNRLLYFPGRFDIRNESWIPYIFWYPFTFSCFLSKFDLHLYSRLKKQTICAQAYFMDIFHSKIRKLLNYPMMSNTLFNNFL